MTRTIHLCVVTAGLVSACAAQRNAPKDLSSLDGRADTCGAVAAILTTPVGCTNEGCFPPLGEIDCVKGLEGTEGSGIPVRVLRIDGTTRQGTLVLAEGERCGGVATGHRSVDDGIEQFVTIELTPKGADIFSFDARLTIIDKAKGKVVGHGGTACAAVRMGEVKKMGTSWVLLSVL